MHPKVKKSRQVNWGTLRAEQRELRSAGVQVVKTRG